MDILCYYICYMSTVTQRKQAQFTFSPALYSLAGSLARSRGLSLAEYVRYLIVREVDKVDVETIRLQEAGNQALKEYYEGKGITLSSEEDIDKMFDSLDNV